MDTKPMPRLIAPIFSFGNNRRLSFLLIVVSLLTPRLIRAESNGSRTAPETIDYYFDLLVKSADANSSANSQDVARRIVSELFDTERLAPQVLQNEWSKINASQKKRFVEALRHDLVTKVHERMDEYKAGAPTLKLKKNNIKKSTASLDYSLAGVSGKNEFTIRMLKYPDGSWKVIDFKSGKEGLLLSYFNYCYSTIETYSFEYLLAELGDMDYIVLEDFDGGSVGELPKGWEWRKGDNDKNKPYEIREESGNLYLAAEDRGESVILGKDVRWNLKEYPYISFKWRVHKIPQGGDERYDNTVDSAAGVYVIYKKKLGLIPVTVKYVWSSTLPVGAAVLRSGVGKPWNVVVESGAANVGEWHTYTFNAYEAYKETFGGDPPDIPIGIGVLSDANSTRSEAFADYDDIRALKQANAGSGIKEKLAAE